MGKIIFTFRGQNQEGLLIFYFEGSKLGVRCFITFKNINFLLLGLTIGWEILLTFRGDNQVGILIFHF